MSTQAQTVQIRPACKVVAEDGRSVTLSGAVFEAISEIMFRLKSSGTVTLHFKDGHFCEVETATRKIYR